MKESFMADLSGVLTDQMGDPFSELITQKSLIKKVIHEEEQSFFRTLEQGLKRIDVVIENTRKENNSVIDGKTVFELYDTFGFPVDLTSLIARENGISINEQEFETELTKQKERSRAATAMETGDWIQLIDDKIEEFVGYDLLSTSIKIVKYRKVIQKQKEFFQVVFNLTPFYPEGGGQVGDTGYIEFDGEKTSVFDTKKENNLIIHLMQKLPENIDQTFTAVVNASKRQASANNHSATHLLHHALRTVLGDHVEQKGSLVSAEYLRFDFSHFEKVSEEQLTQIQSIVSKEIRANIALDEKRNAPMELAKEMGAMALFGEKYGDTVRVIKFGDSVELCGGTHVKATGEIGLFIITSESAVAAGVRRIEAITSEKAEAFYAKKASQLDELSKTLKNPKDILKAVNDLIIKNNALSKEIESFQKNQAKQIKNDLKQKISSINGYNVLAEEIELDAGSIKDILFQLKGENSDFIGIIGGKDKDKCSLSVIISDNLVESKDLHAGNMIKEVAKLIQGGGGGQANYATAGGKNANGLTEAISNIKAKL